MKMKNFYALFNTFLCIGIDIGIGRLCNCHIGIGIGIGRYENQIYRWLSVSADMKKCLSVAHYIRFDFFYYTLLYSREKSTSLYPIDAKMS